MKDLTDRAYLRNEQHCDGRNLDARVRLHQRFSVNTESPNRWMVRRRVLSALPRRSGY